MADFTELVVTAIANAQTHAELTASRVRIVAAADNARRRNPLAFGFGLNVFNGNLALRQQGRPG